MTTKLRALDGSEPARRGELRYEREQRMVKQLESVKDSDSSEGEKKNTN